MLIMKCRQCRMRVRNKKLHIISLYLSIFFMSTSRRHTTLSTIKFPEKPSFTTQKGTRPALEDKGHSHPAVRLVADILCPLYFHYRYIIFNRFYI